MIKSELIANLSGMLTGLSEKKIADGVNDIIDRMAEALIDKSRIEIRGFGSFSLHHRPSRQSRNPKTGEIVFSKAKNRPHFRPGKDLRERVNESRERFQLKSEDD